MKSLSTSNFINILGVFNFTLLLAVSASLLFSSPQNSNANTVSAADSFASISNEDTVTIPITPTATQAEYTATNKITFSSSCSAGAYVYINTSGSDNDLTRTGSDTGTKTISSLATGVSGLTDNTWGFKTSGNAFSEVPVASAPVVLYTSTGVETDTEIDVIYGVKTDHNLPSGTYTNDVVYTVAAKPECLAYTLKFDTGGGTAISDQSVNYGSTVDLSSFTTTRANYIFGGWSNGTSDFTGSETAANPNPDNQSTVTLSACWMKDSAYEYDHTGGEQRLTTPCNGYYKLEVWGAAGGKDVYDGWRGGYGGYAVGVSYGSKNSTFYVNVGGRGNGYTSDTSKGRYSGDSYNGGGGTGTSADYPGGGATHIATVSGELKNLSAYKDTGGTNVSRQILIVAGGGGGEDNRVPAGNGGGFQGNYGYYSSTITAYGGTQTAGGSSNPVVASLAGSFGQGGSNTLSQADKAGAGGGGWYGGGASYFNSGRSGPGGGGSGYIGSSNLISGGGVTKHMTCYSCSTSPASSPNTYTISNTSMSESAISDYSKASNGYAKILYLGPVI